MLIFERQIEGPFQELVVLIIKIPGDLGLGHDHLEAVGSHWHQMQVTGNTRGV